MEVPERLQKMDWTPTPTSNALDKDELLKLLNCPRKYKLFCIHNWTYWTFGKASKLHRVCTKCYKKQQNIDVLNTYNNWVNEVNY